MATFSFTIPASDVNTIKNTTGQSSFEAVADRGLSRKSKHNVLTAKFGDGYEQRVLDGINTKQDMFDISSNSGIEKFNETPPTKKVYNGKIINKPNEI